MRTEGLKQFIISSREVAVYTLLIAGLLTMIAFMPRRNGATALSHHSVSVIEALSSQPVNPRSSAQAYISGAPAHIDISDVAISLDIVPGHYYPSSKSWTLSLDKAQYGVMTAPSNNRSGLTFIYAHNRRGIFQNLPKIQPGSIARVTTENGHVFTYSFRTSAITKPADTSIFSYIGKPVLVAQTCSGEWFQNRQLFIFDYVGVT